MTDTLPTLAHGDEYLVIYVGGPNDGRTDTRIIGTDGLFDTEVTVLTAVDGKETLENYDLTSFTEVGEKYHVTFTWDKVESEAANDPEDRGDRQ